MKQFISDKEGFKPIRFIITLTWIAIMIGVVIKFIKPTWLTDTFMGILLGQLSVLIGADTWRQNAKDKYVKKETNDKG